MSQLSEQIERTIERLETTTDDSILGDPYSVGMPYVDEMLAYHGAQVMQNMRRTYRRMQGSAPFDSPVDAEEKVKPLMLEAMLSPVVSAFADGVQMGQEKSGAYRKYKMYGKLEEIFEADIFREESEVYANNVITDPDSCQTFRKYMDLIAHQFMHGTGFINMFVPEDAPETERRIGMAKIWDLWYLAMRSNLIGAYHVGWEMGKRQAEDTVLSGILAASEEHLDG